MATTILIIRHSFARCGAGFPCFLWGRIQFGEVAGEFYVESVLFFRQGFLGCFETFFFGLGSKWILGGF